MTDWLIEYLICNPCAPELLACTFHSFKDGIANDETMLQFS